MRPLRLFTSRTLPERLVIPRPSSMPALRASGSTAGGSTARSHDPDNEEDGPPCLNTSAYRLFSSGILFTRPYGPGCHRKPIPFDRTPEWTARWHIWPW